MEQVVQDETTQHYDPWEALGKLRDCCEELKEAVKALQGNLGEVNRAVTQIVNMLVTVDKKIDGVDTKVNKIEKSLLSQIGGVDKKVDNVQTALLAKIAGVNTNVDNVQTVLLNKIVGVDAKVDGFIVAVKSDVQGLGDDVKDLGDKVDKIVSVPGWKKVLADSAVAVADLKDALDNSAAHGKDLINVGIEGQRQIGERLKTALTDSETPAGVRNGVKALQGQITKNITILGNQKAEWERTKPNNAVFDPYIKKFISGQLDALSQGLANLI